MRTIQRQLVLPNTRRRNASPRQNGRSQYDPQHRLHCDRLTTVDSPAYHETGGNNGNRKRAILLDFDNTATEHHSGGVLYDAGHPMGEANRDTFKRVVSDWISQGHDVAILTRGIDTKISIYFTTILNMSHIMNDHRPGYISIYAPDEKTFREDHDALWWATMKVTFAASFLQVANVSPNDAIFVDDTAVNVQTMKRAYPSMKCLHAEAGEYVQTFSVLNFII